MTNTYKHLTLLATVLLSACSQSNSLTNPLTAITTLSHGGVKIIQTEIGPVALGCLPDKQMGQALPSSQSETPKLNFSLLGQTVPASASVQQYCLPVRHQGLVGACTAFAATALVETILNKENLFPGNKVSPLSPKYFYYMERVLGAKKGDLDPKAPKRDTGAPAHLAAQTINTFGMLPEQDAPYVGDKQILAYEASAAEQAAAKLFKVKRAVKIMTLQGMKSSLANGRPFMFGFKVYPSFMTRTTARTGEMMMPVSGERFSGGHAVLAVGYDDKKQAFLVKNSWGQGWGQAGYFWMPYTFFTPSYVSSSLYGNCWTLE
jgi:C1A family cysteine protease